MSKDLRHRAAVKLRAAANAASASPWEADDTEIYGPGYDDEGRKPWVAETLNLGASTLGLANGAYIALMHPGVALALADLLDAVRFDSFGGDARRLTEQLSALVLGDES